MTLTNNFNSTKSILIEGAQAAACFAGGALIQASNQLNQSTGRSHLVNQAGACILYAEGARHAEKLIRGIWGTIQDYRTARRSKPAQIAIDQSGQEKIKAIEQEKPIAPALEIIQKNGPDFNLKDIRLQSLAYTIQNYQLNPEQRYEAAKTAVDYDRETAVQNIRNFDLELETQRYEIISRGLESKKGAYLATALNIQHFDLTPIHRFEIAKFLAINAPREFAEYLDRFQLNQDQRFEIAQIIGKEYASVIARYIKSFNLTSEQRFEIAKRASLTCSAGVAEYLILFDLNAEQLYELAKFMALEGDARVVAIYIEHFKLGEEQRFEIAKLTSQHGGAGNTAVNIKEFKLKAAERFEVAKLTAEYNGGDTADYIYNFELEPQQRYVIAKIAVQNNSGVVARCIQSFDLQDPLQRFVIAKLAAERNGEETAKYINRFDLDQDQRFEVAKIAAQQNGKKTAIYIKDFGLNSAQCFEVAKLAATRDGWMAQFIENFELADAAERYEVAKLAALQNGEPISLYIDLFKLENQDWRFEVAKLAAHQNPNGTAKSIRNYALQDPAHRFEIAKISAAIDSTPGEFINLFDLDDPIFRFEVAKVAARRNGVYTAFTIDKYNLENPDHRFEVAKIAVKQNFQSLIRFENFKLADPAQHYEIAKLAAQQEGTRIAEYILMGQFTLTQDQRREIFLLAISNNPLSISLLEKFYGDEDLNLGEIDIDTPQSLEIFAKTISDYMPKTNIQQILTDLQKIENPIQKKALLALIAASIFLWKKTLSKEQFSWIDQQNWIEKIVSFRAPHLRTMLFKSVGESAKRADEFKKIFLEIEKKSPWGALLKMPIARLSESGVDPTFLIQDINKNARHLKDSMKFRSLLQTLELFSQEQELTVNEKRMILKFLTANPDRLLDRAKELLMILEWKGTARLKELSDEKPLSLIAQEVFESLIPLPVPVDDFAIRYAQVFGAYRIPNALKIYAAKLQTLNDPLLTHCLGAHVAAVLNGTYRELRYSPLGNPHLAIISPEILGKWQINSSLPLSQIAPENAPHQEKESLLLWLDWKLNVDKHLNLNRYNFLKTYLQAEEEDEQNVCFEGLIEAIKNDSKNKDLILQKKCIELARSGSDANALRLLTEIEKQESIEGSEFLNDIRAKIKQLGEAVQPRKELYIVETDDPEDVLLCGTESQGSCQRLDGNPQLNKGLLGYLRHGQTRLIAIKDGEHGPIVARALLRLLTEGKKPVLFLERIYNNTNEKKLDLAIKTMAKKCAERLGCPVTALDGKGFYHKSLKSLGGPAPYEYCDSAHGITSQGRFTIDAPRILD